LKKSLFVVPVAILSAYFIWAGPATARRKGSLAMRATSLGLKARGKPMGDLQTSQKRVESRAYPIPAPISGSLERKVAVVEAWVGKYKVVTLTPRKNVSPWHIIYYHGGAYVEELMKPHWDIIEALIEATGATVTVPHYPLAPEHNHREAYAFLTNVYRKVLKQADPQNVVLVGDSAGGGLVLGQALGNAALELPAPARLILFSPWLDLSVADDATLKVEPDDVMLSVDSLRYTGRLWAAGDDLRLPQLSPLYADLTGLPPIDLYQGSHDLFVIDARTFVRKVELAGGTIRYFEFPGAFHVFVAATFTPEAKMVFRDIGATLSNDAAARLS
jgi:epsilon-lactone hydrolase